MMSSVAPANGRLLSVLAGLGEGVILLDGAGTILHASPRACALWPAAAEAADVPGLGLPEALGPEPTLAVGEGGPVLVRALALPEGEGAILLAAYVPDGAALARTLQLYASLLHDLRNPMAGVPMLAQAFEFEMEQVDMTGSAQDICVTYMQRISREVQRMARFLDFTRNLGPAGVGEAGPIPARAVVGNALERERSAIHALGVGVDVELAADLVLMGAPGPIHQSYSNLMGAATLRLGPGGGPVLCGARREGASVGLYVSARGGGLEQARWQDVLGDPIPSPRDLTGVELILLTVRHLAELGGGTLERREGESGRVEGVIRLPAG